MFFPHFYIVGDTITEEAHIDCSQSSIFSVRSSRSSALRYGLPPCLSVKTAYGAGAVWEEARKIEGLYGPPPPTPRAIIPDSHTLGTIENQDSRNGKTRYI